MTVLVVGGNGQLGAACCEELVARGVPVRATVRAAERGADLAEKGVALQELDLTDGSDARRRALEGCEVLLLSANSVAPRAGDDVKEIDRAVPALVAAAAAAGVRRIVLPSIPVTDQDDQIPFASARRTLEQQVLDSFDGAVVQLPPFTDVWLALVGSSLPLRGEAHATIARPSPFLSRFRTMTGSVVEKRGLMLVPGSPGARHAFLTVRDAARACVEVALSPEAFPRPIEVGGPEILSWRDVARIFTHVLDRRVRVVATPGLVYGAAATLLGPVATVPARTMALNRYLAAAETPWTPPGGGLLDPDSMTTVEAYLREKAALGEPSTTG